MRFWARFSWSVTFTTADAGLLAALFGLLTLLAPFAGLWPGVPGCLVTSAPILFRAAFWAGVKTFPAGVLSQAALRAVFLTDTASFLVAASMALPASSDQDLHGRHHLEGSKERKDHSLITQLTA